MSRKDNHIHRFKRDHYKTGEAFYYCTNGCNFKIAVKHSLGMHCLCNSCGNIFTMNEYSIRRARPICMNCVKRVTTGVSNANNVERIPIANDAVKSLKERLQGNTVIKEYNPEDDDGLL